MKKFLLLTLVSLLPFIANAMTDEEFGVLSLECTLKQDMNACDKILPVSQERCNSGTIEACAMASAVHVAHGKFDDAMTYAMKGCDLGDGNSCGITSVLYLERRTNAITKEQAIANCQKACDMTKSPIFCEAILKQLNK
jgi:hypothetical protein